MENEGCRGRFLFVLFVSCLCLVVYGNCFSWARLIPGPNKVQPAEEGSKILWRDQRLCRKKRFAEDKRCPKFGRWLVRVS